VRETKRSFLVRVAGQLDASCSQHTVSAVAPAAVRDEDAQTLSG
jgi:hypothetical protein